jgi:hypothetical protein
MVKEQWEFLKGVAKLIEYIKSSEWIATGGELYRTQYQQDHYLATGYNKAKYSKHQDRLAIDLNFFDKNGKLIECPKIIGDYWCSLNPKNEWGGNWAFYDPGHFQRD